VEGAGESGSIKVPDAFARAQALLLDSLILFLPTLLVWFLLRLWLDGRGYLGNPILNYYFGFQPGGMIFGTVGSFLSVLIIPGLFALEAVTRGRTPGKLVTGLRVISGDGSRITVRQALVRNLARLVDMLPALYLLGLATMTRDKLNRRIGDRLAGCMVICEREEGHLLFMRKPARRPGRASTRPPLSS